MQSSELRCRQRAACLTLLVLLAMLSLGLWSGAASGEDKPALRGYPETLSSCHSDITQHSCGSETQGDRKEKAY